MIAAAAAPAVSLSEAQAFLRLETGEEEALAAGLIRSATQYCEAFIGQAIIARRFALLVPANGQWQRLPITPVRSISLVELVDAAGDSTPLAAGQYGADINSSGDGWVQAGGAGAGNRARVSGEAGMADEANDVPEPIRQGILRLAAHLFSNRDGPDGEPPAAVTALWRPYRRMRLS